MPVAAGRFRSVRHASFFNWQKPLPGESALCSTSKKETAGTETAEPSGGNMKNEGKKIQNESMKSLSRLNSVLVDLQYNSSELQRNTMESGSLLM